MVVDTCSPVERPETTSIGTNELIGTDPSKLPPVLGAIDGRGVEKRRDPSEMGWQGVRADRRASGTNTECELKREHAESALFCLAS